MTSLFEKNLIRAKQELTDLKTAHNRGLGTVEFFKQTITFTSTANVYHTVIADIATGEPQKPLLFASASASSGYVEDARIGSTNSGTTTVRANVFCRQSSSVTVELIASSVIKNIRRS